MLHITARLCLRNVLPKLEFNGATSTKRYSIAIKHQSRHPWNMNITIIGVGNMGHAIGTRLVAGGHALTLLDQDGNKAKEVAEKLGSTVKGAALTESVDGEVVIFALPYPAIPEVIEKYKDQLAGKILVDISNPVNFNTFEIIPPRTTSGAEEIAKQLPKGAKLVKAFNTTLAGTLVKGDVEGKKLDVLIASDDKDAAEMVVKLADESGMRGLHVGPLSKSQTLEGLGLIHMSLQEKLGSNWMSAVKFLP